MGRSTDDHGSLDFRVMSLAGGSGMKLAKKLNVNSVPTIIFDNSSQMRIVGVPDEHFVDEITGVKIA